jgi:radical SAM protein with 4Fe4S-binding SPASM domain
MTEETAERIVDMLSEAKVFKLYITGGEPLLWEPLSRIVSYANSKGVWPLIQTNGTLLTDSLAKRLVGSKLGVLDISVYGIDETTHNYITGSQSSFRQVSEALQKCKRYGIRTCVSFVILKQNLGELTRVFKWGMDKGLDLIHIRRYVAKSLDDPYRPGNPEAMRTIEEGMKILEEINTPREKIHVEFEEGFPGHHGLGRDICAASSQLCLINVEGRISPCPFIRVYGENALEGGFRHVWVNSKILNQLRNIKNFEGICGRCKLRKDCKGGCRAAAYQAYGRFDASDPDCRVVHDK